MNNSSAGRPALSRRAVLGAGVTVGATAAIAAVAPGTAVAGPGRATPFGRGDLPTGVRGAVLLPGDPGYDAAVSPFNLNQIPRPGVVFAAAAATDVQAAVRFAAGRRAPAGVLATGHQPSVPIGPDAVLVSTRAMRGVHIDPRRRTARVEAGALWDDVVTASLKHGLAPLNGSTGTVGVVGYTLGGGLSPTIGRKYGYAADHVRGIDLVSADGRLRTVTAQSDRELFFGLRGGKSNFGIVTALEFDLFPVTTLYGGAIIFDGRDAGRLLHAYRRWVRTVPDAMSSSVALLRLPDLPQVPTALRGKLVASLRISYTGRPDTGAALVRPLRAVAVPMIDSVAEMPYAAFPAIHGDPTTPTPAYERTGLLRELGADTVDALLSIAGPGRDVPLAAVEIRHLGGALARPPRHPNAVSHRDAAFTLFMAGVGGPEAAPVIRKAAADVVRVLRPWSTGGMYVNFMNTDDTSDRSVRSAYRPDVYRRLEALKRRVDPRNTFRLNHNIKPC
ncbi:MULTISPECIES: FAD-binding oxidoreductase [Catenuloplanes]|uniref:UDP-N-acetylenolpyruvoylglucosamine reductase n=1 Tax=Catenuloplanes niger TaxID=587534 RepID=A0AAE3ZM52_9ACTN|nr:FAD-binding protein [Catenuloplanes niger]MDR7320678.1 UDP-N-acetylenolpyruvoylglucosamine reductase [Catenuloplanes niger]